MSFADLLSRVPVLSDFAFTPDGHHVARLAHRDGVVAVEARDLRGNSPLEHVCRIDSSSRYPQISFSSANRILISSGREGEGYFQLLEACRGGAQDRSGGWVVRPIAGCEASIVSLLSRLEGAGWDLAVSYADGMSTIVAVEDARPRLRPLARVPGVLTVAGWLDPERTLAVTITDLEGVTSGYVIDLVARTSQRVFHISDASNDRIVGSDPLRGLLWVTTDCSGYRRAGVVAPGDGQRVRFFPDLPGEERSVTLCGRSGRQAVLSRWRGTVTELWLADPASLSVRGPLELPDGVVSSPVVDAGDRFRFAFSTPTVPMACASYLPDRDLFRFEEAPDLAGLTPHDLVTPRLTTFSGPHGDFEALVYEPPRTRRRDLIVVALHGGPVLQWSAAYTSELQLLAGLGAVVVAPNYHGSAGYGDRFVEALQGGAGSVDVDDAMAVITAMQRGAGPGRAAMVLYGQSYGAFLALSVAAIHPRSCDGVIALAPFTSLSSMWSAGTPAVRRLVDLLKSPIRGEEGPDILLRCGELRAKLLIAHGTRDPVVPFEQSEVLCDRLRAHGYRDGRDLWFLPLPEENHHVLASPAGALQLYRQIESFLSEVTTPSPPGVTATEDRYPNGGRMWQAGGQLPAHPSSLSGAAPPQRR